jgi:hypothetical protein
VLRSNRSPHNTSTSVTNLKMVSDPLRRRPIGKKQPLSYYVAFCKRYWGTQMNDYGTSTRPEADKFIDDNKSIWKTQAEQGKA